MDDNERTIVKAMAIEQMPCMCGYHKCRYCGENAGTGCSPMKYCPHCGCPRDLPVETKEEV